MKDSLDNSEQQSGGSQEIENSHARRARIRHDLKTPINHILGYAEMLLEELPQTSRELYTSDLNKIINAGRQLLSQVRFHFDDSQTRPTQLDLPRLQHEFRTPLNHIIGYAEIITEQAEDSEDALVIKDLGRIVSAAKTLLELLEAHLISNDDAIDSNGSKSDIVWPSVPIATTDPFDQSEPVWNNAIILIVDDDPLNRDLMQRRLSRQGCQVMVAPSGAEALKILQSQKVDLLLLDMIMPEMDGFAVLAKMKADVLLNRTPVVMLSASDETATTVHCIKMGADDFLPKPCNTTLLLARIESALSKKKLRDIQRKESSFFHDKGTLRADSQSYVERQADRDLQSNLQSNEMCYVLTSRQMGKSSLMVRTASKLREQGVGVIVLDLTSVGSNVTPEQWYDGLLNRAARQLRLEDEMEDYWFKYDRLSPVQRLFGSIREVAMNQYSGPLVVFIDEVDAVRSLPFAADEFLAAMRACFNRRAEDEAFNRLTFCLLGVAKPDDLIKDSRSTPFNIAERIELADFESGALVVLGDGLNRSKEVVGPLLNRIYYWTHGHPYLTQRLCRALADDDSVQDADGLDALCEKLFLTAKAQEEDDNLNFVKRWLLSSPASASQLLQTYLRVLEEGGVDAVSISEPSLQTLLLAGVVSMKGDKVTVRNRIYARVFNSDWVKRQLRKL